MRHIAALPAAGLLAGAAAGLLVDDIPHAPGILLLLVLAAAASIAWRAARAPALAAIVVCAFFAGGALLAHDAWRRAWRPPLRVAFEALARRQRADAAREGRRLPDDDEAFATVEGVLRADASPAENGVSLSVDVETAGDPRVPAAGGILVTVAGSLGAARMDAWRAGRRVRLPVQLRRPSRYLDPGVPDNERALARRWTTLVGTVKSAALVEVTARGSALQEAIAAVRAFARRAIADAVGRWSVRSAAIVAAIVIGDRAGLDADVQRRLQEAGTYHVIAISGGNIAILAGLLLGAFRLAGHLGRTAMIASVAALVAYADLVGNGASVDRATLMAVVYFGARALDHRSPPLNALAVVAALLVVSDPLAVADPAFVLTFGATLAILVAVPAVTTIGAETAENADASTRRSSAGFARSSLHVARGAARSMAAASVAAEALLLPIGALVFARITFAGLALNFVAIPLMAAAQIAGMAVVPIAAASRTAASLAGAVAHLGAAGLVRSADLVSLAPVLTYRVAPPPWIAIVIYYAAVAAWWTLWRQRVETTGSAETAPARRARLCAAVVAATAALWILIDPRAIVASRGDGRLHVTVIDVGQGDSIFVAFPAGATMLVDAGGTAGSAFDTGDRVVAPVLRAAGRRRLDVLALTHGDPDHVGGAASILREFRPREVWEGIPVPRSAALTELRAAARIQAAPWANVYAGDRTSIDGVDIVAHHPRPAEWERQRVRNDDSVVLELRWRDVSVVLTGDAGVAAERGMIGAFAPARLRVVKIGHHGSLTSSAPEFIRALHPQVAIVSAGRSNHFGHPVPEVLDRYRTAGAEVFRTDRDGAVTVESDGYALEVGTFAGRRMTVPPTAHHEGTKIHEDTKQ